MASGADARVIRNLWSSSTVNRQPISMSEGLQGCSRSYISVRAILQGDSWNLEFTILRTFSNLYYKRDLADSITLHTLNGLVWFMYQMKAFSS